MARCPTCHRRLPSGEPCPEHGGAIGASSAPEPGPAPVELGEPVGACLGVGGFASVWELGRGRVVKLAHAAHDLSRARMAREAEALEAIGAPAVPTLHGAGELADGRPWLVMDRVVGTSFADLTTVGPVRPHEALALGSALLGALKRVHAARFVHRDIKPENLVRQPDGRVVILDLGLARKLPTDPDDPTRAHVQVGSLEYIAPEQIEDSAAVDERSDLYAFGCVLFELYTGRPPFLGDAAALERAHAALRPPRLGALVTVPAAIEALVHDCLAKEPARRPASAAEARGRLRAANDDTSDVVTGHSVSVIREGKQPVVLLWAELPRVDRALLGMLTGRRLVVASQRGRRVLAGVLGGEHADPASVAIAAARDLVAAGARVALHLDALAVDSSAGASLLRGEPVERPETWLPVGAWTGVVLTRALASVIRAPTRASDAGSEFRTLADELAATELFGREVLLTDLAADAAAALHGLPRPREGDASGGRRPRRESSSGSWQATGPAFALVFGEPGMGKTAFADALARRIRELGARVHVGTVPAPGAGKPAHSALAGLIGTPEGPLVRAIGDALRAAARAQPTAVILDDLHHADHELLDALEYATLGGEPIPLWVLGVASPRLDGRRPQLGSRAERRRRDQLAPLDEDAAVALTAALLRPAEYPPLRALRRLVALAHGNPLHLAMLAREIHDRGAIKPRPGGAHYLDTSALDELSPAALGPWLAARELAGMGGELVALARLCAVLGGEVQRDELVAIVDAVERAGGATTTIDVDIGLAELGRAGILLASERGYRFGQALVEEGIYATTNEDERLALHRAALAHWRGGRLDDPQIAERVARHAEAVGDPPIAAEAFAQMGERALVEQRTFDADHAWSGALRNLERRDTTRARALLGRARSRSRLQRMYDALADLEEAVAIAGELGAVVLQLEAMIEQSTVLDHCENFDASRTVAERARARLVQDPEPHPELGIDLDLADARVIYREQRFAEAAPRLREIHAAARAAGRAETETIAGLMLGCALADIRQLDDAERVFEETIARCQAIGDRYHLGAAFGNRAWLWSARGELDRTSEDLRSVIQISRENGQAQLERAATHNLAEHVLWEGDLDTALQLARRGFALQSRAGEGTTHPDRLLLARVLAARAELAELAELLATFVADDGLGEDERFVLSILRATAGSTSWQLDQAGLDGLYVGLRVEIAHLAARQGHLDAALRPYVIEVAAGDPVWSKRLGEL